LFLYILSGQALQRVLNDHERRSMKAYQRNEIDPAADFAVGVL